MPDIRMTPVKNLAVHAPSPDREAALQMRVAELEDELRARDEFLAIAAHELRNPMTPISARLELLLARARNSAERLPKGIAQGLEQLEQLVEAYIRRATILLEVSRINSGNLRLQSADVDLSALIRKVAADLTPLAERADCPIRLNVQDGIVLRCDEMAMQQILENLLTNAIRYGPGAPIEIGFKTDGNRADLSVGDEGVGIAEADQEEIFERFHSLRRSSPKGGFGVGLWVTRQLVRTMNGEITVASRPGAGSIFTVSLPVQPRAGADGH